MLKSNPAQRLYHRLGFEIIDEQGDSYAMCYQRRDIELMLPTRECPKCFEGRVQTLPLLVGRTLQCPDCGRHLRMTALYRSLFLLASIGVTGLLGYQLFGGAEARGTAYLLLEALAIWLLIVWFGALEVVDARA